MKAKFVVSTDKKAKFWFFPITAENPTPELISETVGLVHGQQVQRAGLWKIGNNSDVRKGLSKGLSKKRAEYTKEDLY